MEAYPGITVTNIYPYRWSIILREDRHSHLWEKRPFIRHNKPTAELATSLDDLVGKGNWLFRTVFHEYDPDEERMFLWFHSESDMLAARLMLIG